MHKGTKVFLIVAFAAVAVFAGWFGVEQYGCNHPKITVSFLSSGEGEENVFTVPHIDLTERSVFGISELWDERFYDAYAVIGQMIDFAHSYCDYEHYFFDSSVEIVDGKTVFTIAGYYTDSGNRIETSETYMLDYVLTKDIKEH